MNSNGSTANLGTEFARIRARSMALAAPLSAGNACVQSMPDASPVKWHLAHTTWFFETFLLEPFEPGFRPFRPGYRVLFNSYYNSIGDKHPRGKRVLHHLLGGEYRLRQRQFLYPRGDVHRLPEVVQAVV